MMVLETAVSSRVLHPYGALRPTRYAPSCASSLCRGDLLGSASVGMPPGLSPRPPYWVPTASVASEPLGFR